MHEDPTLQAQLHQGDVTKSDEQPLHLRQKPLQRPNSCFAHNEFLVRARNSLIRSYADTTVSIRTVRCTWAHSFKVTRFHWTDEWNCYKPGPGFSYRFPDTPWRWCTPALGSYYEARRIFYDYSIIRFTRIISTSSEGAHFATVVSLASGSTWKYVQYIVTAGLTNICYYYKD